MFVIYSYGHTMFMYRCIGYLKMRSHCTKCIPCAKTSTVLFRLFALDIFALVVLGHTAYSVTRNTKLGKFATKFINDIKKHELLQNATKSVK